MSLLRRGSSHISEENFNSRLQREKAKTGAITVSLAWNDPSDLDLHAEVFLTSGGKAHICYGKKQEAGGHLDVDMHARDTEIVEEPVENIFWRKPPAGVYKISANLYAKRGSRADSIPFRALLKREDEEPLSVEGAAAAKSDSVECFRFTVDEEGNVTMGKVGSPLPQVVPVPMKATKSLGSIPVMKAMKVASMKAMKVMKAMKPKVAMKAMKAMKPMKTSTIATGKKAKLAVYKGKKLKTKGGLKAADLIKSKDRKIVSAKKSAAGKASKWAIATAKARAEKGYTGFKAIKKGTSFYSKAKDIMAGL